MKKIALFSVIALFLAVFAAGAARADELADFAARINTKFGVDLGPFKGQVAAEFGTGEPRVEAVIKAAGSAGDAYLAFRIGKALNKPPEEVATYYAKNKGKGWGVIAKDMGIKPGSAEFHALKKGKLVDGDDDGKGKDKDKGGKPDDKGKDKGGKPEGKGGGKNK